MHAYRYSFTNIYCDIIRIMHKYRFSAICVIYRGSRGIDVECPLSSICVIYLGSRGINVECPLSAICVIYWGSRGINVECPLSTIRYLCHISGQ